MEGTTVQRRPARPGLGKWGRNFQKTPGRRPTLHAHLKYSWQSAMRASSGYAFALGTICSRRICSRQEGRASSNRRLKRCGGNSAIGPCPDGAAGCWATPCLALRSPAACLAAPPADLVGGVDGHSQGGLQLQAPHALDGVRHTHGGDGDVARACRGRAWASVQLEAALDCALRRARRGPRGGGPTGPTRHQGGKSQHGAAGQSLPSRSLRRCRAGSRARPGRSRRWRQGRGGRLLRRGGAATGAAARQGRARRRRRGSTGIQPTDADVLVEDVVGAHHRGQVEQRLPHAHEHDVGDALQEGWVGGWAWGGGVGEGWGGPGERVVWGSSEPVRGEGGGGPRMGGGRFQGGRARGQGRSAGAPARGAEGVPELQHT